MTDIKLQISDEGLKAVSLLAASALFGQPQFSQQVNPTNIVGLAELFYKFTKNDLQVNLPTAPEDAQAAAPTFG